MTTTADRRAADHLIAAALELEASAQDMRAMAQQMKGGPASAIESYRAVAKDFRHYAASKRQDAEEVPHNSEVG